MAKVTRVVSPGWAGPLLSRSREVEVEEEEEEEKEEQGGVGWGGGKQTIGRHNSAPDKHTHTRACVYV